MSRTCDLTNNGVLYGNKVSHSAIKNKRKFLPNLQNINLKSDSLNQNFNFKVATKTLRTINKYGSLDSFLINIGYNHLSEKGKALRKKVMTALMKSGEYENIKIVKKTVSRDRNKKQPETEEKKCLKMAKILVAMSGGVDSSVTALKLLEQKYDVVGVTLAMGRKCDLQAIEDAKKVANFLGIEHKVLGVGNEFKNKVVDYFINSYLSGETPNPCAVCNRTIKFKSIIDLMQETEADFIATGHYANITENNGNYELHKAKYLQKDQSYFLSDLKYDYLRYIKFPLGIENSKEEVRLFAKKNDLAVAEKKDSQDVCFIDTNYKNFILQNRKIVEKKGLIKHVNGEILGEHTGILNYTIGQRRGLSISYKTPLYVVKFDIDNNIVYVGGDEDLFSNKLIIENLNLLANLEKKLYTIKLRSTHKGQNGSIKLLENNTAEITLEEKTRAITKGQLCCIYDDTKVIGSGWIC